ncbi:MAG: hydroxymethylbilane synthase [Acidimicrobiales bacterium]
MTRRLRVATRGSTLARTQTASVVDLLAPDTTVEMVVVKTEGDRRTDTDIWQIGGQGVFVKEVEAAVLDGRADFAVHSAKDLPSALAPGLTIAAVPRRADPRDALVGSTLAALPTGGRVGTGSVRRRAQLSWFRPDLTFGGLRGNIETRLARRDGFSAIVVAAAALERLGLLAAATELLDPTLIVPQVGQGALAVECRTDDDELRDRLGRIADPASARAVSAERAFLAEVGGGCDVPLGAHATVDAAGDVTLTGLLATLDGRIAMRATRTGPDPEEVGRTVARHVLDDCGGSALVFELELQ